MECNQKSYCENFSKIYSKMGITAVTFLIFRDLPKLIKKFVEGTKALDYGCGPGISTRFFKTLGLEVDGVDICVHAITLAKESDPDGKYETIKSAKIPTDDELYDFVYAGLMFSHIPTKPEMVHILTEIKRVLKPGGTLIISDPTEDTYKHNWLEIETDFDENKSPDLGSVVKLGMPKYNLTVLTFYWTRQDYYDVIAESGLDLVDEHNPLGNNSDGFAWINEDKVPIATMYVVQKKLV